MGFQGHNLLRLLLLLVVRALLAGLLEQVRGVRNTVVVVVVVAL